VGTNDGWNYGWKYLMSDKKYYRQSEVGMFLKCARQYMHRYLLGEITPPNAALTLGSSVDTAVTHNFEQKIETKTDLKIDYVVDIFSTDYENRKTETEWDEDPGKIKDIGVKLIRLHQETAAPKIQPVSVQETFFIDTDVGYGLTGTMDLTDENDFIRDTKTSKSSYSEEKVSDSLQATMYSTAFEVNRGKAPKGFVFDVLVKTKEPKYQEIKGEISKGQKEIMFDSINIMHNQIARGEFQYAPEGAWWCSKDWCGYWYKCKGKKS
jgi:hypothetical protein